MSDFPTAGVKEDSRFFAELPEDPAVRSETEGGYIITRPRHTRTPRKTFDTGFTSISQASKAAIDAFYATKRGGSQSFTWTNPTTAVEHTVRFKGALKWKYDGFASGQVHLWSATVQLEEV